MSTQLRLLDVHDTSPKTLSAERMSYECGKEIVESLYDGAFRLTAWQIDFVHDMRSLYKYTLPQRKVIYNLAHKFRLL